MIEEKNCPGCFRLHGRRVPIAAWLADCPWCGYRFIIAPQVHRKPRQVPVSGVLKDGTRWENLVLL
jgi:hypothetical protein